MSPASTAAVDLVQTFENVQVPKKKKYQKNFIQGRTSPHFFFIYSADPSFDLIEIRADPLLGRLFLFQISKNNKSSDET